MRGYTEDALATLHFITYNLALLNVTSNDLNGDGQTLESEYQGFNLNIANTFCQVSKNGQTLVLSVHMTNQGYYARQLVGYQNTRLANVGNQVSSESQSQSR